MGALSPWASFLGDSLCYRGQNTDSQRYTGCKGKKRLIQSDWMVYVGLNIRLQNQAGNTYVKLPRSIVDSYIR